MESTPFTVADIVVVVVLLISALLAYMRGFVHEVLSVVGWVGAIFATIYAFPYVRPYAREIIAIELAADLAAGVGIFVVTLVALSLVTRAAAKLVHASALNVLDRSLGFLFGIIRGGVLVCLAYLAIDWLTPEQPDWLRSARSIKLIEAGADTLKSLVPEDAASASSDAAGRAQQEAEKVLETHRALSEILKTEPQAPSLPTEDGYGRRERLDMDRLIQGNQ